MTEKQPTLLSEMHAQVNSLLERSVMYRNIGQRDKADAYSQIATEIKNRIAKTRKIKS